MIVVTSRWIFSRTYWTFKNKRILQNSNIFILHTYAVFQVFARLWKMNPHIVTPPEKKGHNQKPFLLPLNFPFSCNKNMQHFFSIFLLQASMRIKNKIKKKKLNKILYTVEVRKFSITVKYKNTFNIIFIDAIFKF